jgi:myo-inositol-hexaphosphate 3-phosphohydrolase
MKPRAVNLSANLTPAALGYPAKFTLKKPDASLVTKSILTDTQGKAVAQFSLGQRYPHGTYVGKVEIVVDGKTISDSQSVVL